MSTPIIITLTHHDYLTYQLYTASKSSRIRRQRRRTWIVTTLVLLLTAFLFYRAGEIHLAGYFLIVGVATLALHPLYSRWLYKRHYEKHINEYYKNRFGDPITLAFSDQTVFVKDKTGESTINTSEIEEINEIKSHYFVKLTSGPSLIIPKDNNESPDRIKADVQSLAETKGIPHHVEPGWKWK